MKWLATFKGRQVGAIGITYQIGKVIEAPNHLAAKVVLYSGFEHVQNLGLITVAALTRAALIEIRDESKAALLCQECGTAHSLLLGGALTMRSTQGAVTSMSAPEHAACPTCEAPAGLVLVDSFTASMVLQLRAVLALPATRLQAALALQLAQKLAQ